MATSQAEKHQAEPIRYLAIQLTPVMSSTTHATSQTKGGMKATSINEKRLNTPNVGQDSLEGSRSIYVLVRKGEHGEEAPVFQGENADAVLVFSNRETAAFYLQVADRKDYALRELSPLELGEWAPSLKRDHISLLLVDVNRHHQLQGDPPPRTLNLQTIGDISGENLYQEIVGAG